jgi:hypothetical protein
MEDDILKKLYTVLDAILQDCDEDTLAAYNRFLKKEEIGEVLRLIYWRFYKDDDFLKIADELFGAGATEGILDFPLKAGKKLSAEDYMDMYNLMDELIEKWIDNALYGFVPDEDKEESSGWAEDLLKDMNKGQ